jgi:hypothetical protein
MQDSRGAALWTQGEEQEQPSPRQQCLNEYYGDSYATAWDISPLSISSILIDGGTKYLTEYLEDKLSQQANRNLYGNSKQYEIGKRQVRTLPQFRKFNAVMAVAGAGALGYIAGANISCTLFRSD